MKEENAKALEMALARASSWFQIHADQRLKVFNFYIVLLAVFVTGFMTLLKENLHQWEIIISVCLFVVTFAFKKLDQRTASLVKNAEAALEKIENTIASASGIEQVNLVKEANTKIRGQLSYRQIFNIIFCLGYGLAVLGFLLSIYPRACTALAVCANMS